VLGSAACRQLHVGVQQAQDLHLVALALDVLGGLGPGAVRSVGRPLGMLFLEDLGAHAAHGRGVAQAHHGGAVAVREAARVDADPPELVRRAAVGAEGCFGGRRGGEVRLQERVRCDGGEDGPRKRQGRRCCCCCCGHGAGWSR
jgi:hypothetical protein